MRPFKCPKCQANHHSIGARVSADNKYRVVGIGYDDKIVIEPSGTDSEEPIMSFICHNCNHSWRVPRDEAVSTDSDDCSMTTDDWWEYKRFNRGAVLKLSWDD